MEAFVVLAQILVLSIVTYFMIDFQMGIVPYIFIIYVLALASSALAVFLGSSVEDPKLATEMLPMLFVPQMLFAGFFVAPDLIPSWLRWAQYLCSLTYSTRLMVMAEFEACSSPGAENCERIIESIDAEEEDKWWYWLVLIGLFVVFRLTALVILRKKATKFF